MSKPEIHMVLDLETLGDNEDAAVFEAGVAAFDANSHTGPILTESFVLSIEDALGNGEISAGTLAFWLTDPSIKPATRERLRKIWGREKGAPVPMAGTEYLLDGVLNFYNRHRPVAVWANGATFDFPIFIRKLRQYNLKAPWSFRDQLCVRPLRRIYPTEYRVTLEEAELLQGTPYLPGSGVHAADYDCFVVAMFLRNVSMRLRREGRTLQGPVR